MFLYYKILSEEEKTCELVSRKQKGYNMATLTIPATALSVDGTQYSVVRVGDSSMQDCDQLTKVVFSEGLKEIGNNVFNRCTNLQYLTIPTTLEKIGNGAFYRCTAL